MASNSLLSSFSIFSISSSVIASFFQDWAYCNNDFNFDSYVYFLILHKSNPLSKGTASNPLSLGYFLIFSKALFLGAWLLLCICLCLGFYFKISFTRSFSIVRGKCRYHPKKRLPLNLSLLGCFGPIDSTSCTHPGSSMLSSTLIDCSFLPPRGLSCLSDRLTLDASHSSKWRPTTGRRFLFEPAIGLSAIVFKFFFWVSGFVGDFAYFAGLHYQKTYFDMIWLFFQLWRKKITHKKSLNFNYHIWLKHAIERKESRKI